MFKFIRKLIKSKGIDKDSLIKIITSEERIDVNKLHWLKDSGITTILLTDPNLYDISEINKLVPFIEVSESPKDYPNPYKLEEIIRLKDMGFNPSYVDSHVLAYVQNRMLADFKFGNQVLKHLAELENPAGNNEHRIDLFCNGSKITYKVKKTDMKNNIQKTAEAILEIRRRRMYYFILPAINRHIANEQRFALLINTNDLKEELFGNFINGSKHIIYTPSQSVIGYDAGYKTILIGRLHSLVTKSAYESPD